jgi:PAS domain-containing protein
MNLLDLLLREQLPVWVATVVAALGVIGMSLYGHLLGRRLKALEHRLHTQAMRHEKQLEFVQERHKKRLDALDELNAAVMDFDHDVMHVRRGDVGYIKGVGENSARARALARHAESLLGADLYQAILTSTDRGRTVLDACFCVTARTAAVLELNGLPERELEALRGLIGTRHPVSRGGDDITEGYDPELRARYQRNIVGTCELSEEFDQDGYSAAMREFSRLKEEILRTLPTPSSDGGEP